VCSTSRYQVHSLNANNEQIINRRIYRQDMSMPKFPAPILFGHLWEVWFPRAESKLQYSGFLLSKLKVISSNSSCRHDKTLILLAIYALSFDCMQSHLFGTDSSSYNARLSLQLKAQASPLRTLHRGSVVCVLSLQWSATRLRRGLLLGLLRRFRLGQD
jgi:hypothetical protein